MQRYVDVSCVELVKKRTLPFCFEALWLSSCGFVEADAKLSCDLCLLWVLRFSVVVFVLLPWLFIVSFFLFWVFLLGELVHSPLL